MERLSAWAKAERPNREVLVLSDIGSGLNAARKRLQHRLKLVCEDRVAEVVITSGDRLTRFGQEYLETLFTSFGITFTVLDADEDKTPEQELTEDLLSLIASGASQVGRNAFAQTKGTLGMRPSRATQSLSYPIRLPDAVQAEALRLLDVSREVINATVVALWPQLDEFGERETKYAYKQVTALIGSSDPHGDRQWRCEAEQAGRILRGQAERKKQFALILPLLSVGMIEPKTEKKPGGKNRPRIKQALSGLREENSDGGNAVELQSLIEQSCNFYLKHGYFPATYEEMQAIPLLKTGILPYAGDDEGDKGQAYRLRFDLEAQCCYFAFRSPDETGKWRATWTEPQMRLPLPDPVAERIQAGATLAPTLREIEEPDGTRYAVLDVIIEVPLTEPTEWQQVQRVLGWDWGVRTLVTATVLDLDGNRLAPPLFLDSGGFDGQQAHTRRHIDRLKSKVAKLEAQRDHFQVGDKRREPSERKLAMLRREIASCWRKYEARNNDLAHLAANILILLATVWQADLIAGESLKSLKSTGHGRSAKGRWVRWRTNSQIRGALWRCLRYKCHLSGLRLAWQYPKGTTHTCPQCGKPADTYASPGHLSKVVDSGAWLHCLACGWNGARDYAAAINIALLGVAFLKQYLQTGQDDHPTMTEKPLNSASYIGAGLALRLPPTTSRGCLTPSGKMYVNGWLKSVTLHSALSRETMLRLCG
jgi:putative transposase